MPVATEHRLADSVATGAHCGASVGLADGGRPDLEEDWCTHYYIYPSPASEEDVLDGSDALYFLAFDAPIAFVVEVPEKN
jgi:hypothetical protein